MVFDYLICMVIPAIAGARLYYVVFSWDYYKEHLGEIIEIRNGGLAIYGGIIAAALVLLFSAGCVKYPWLSLQISRSRDCWLDRSWDDGEIILTGKPLEDLQMVCLQCRFQQIFPGTWKIIRNHRIGAV